MKVPIIGSGSILVGQPAQVRVPRDAVGDTRWCRGTAFVIPGGVAHELEVLEDGHIIDVFSPPREELS